MSSQTRPAPAPGTDGLAELLGRVAGGDRAAFAEVYDQTSHRVYGMVLRVLRDPGYSEETTQEVYLQVWRSADTYDPRLGSALSWIITLAHRRAVDRVRSETAATRRDLGFAADEHMPDFDVVTAAAESRETREEVRGCLESLTEVQRESIGLAYYRGLTYREVSEHLSVALPTVKSRIRDGLNRLRNCLGDNHV
ncbi:sigma-70 family RNA polymerase sigma factor [Gordonia desulfuricans]|uniref:Sigma-70 family RNA polymerase sigma factor n=1 Tax=Gordonia desulfuricans TaxID=89051 RepID=A0A7K3LNC0_9ACTN|nr:sigma-70 family RNA polymerase sigma factor [Gordonia desulfuricans]NDK89764.1 sigma-70 family RNA polymerase sigma factor [Gordonia desulfuricans]